MPEVEIQVGRRKIEAYAVPISPSEAECELRDYARRHSSDLRGISRMIGCEYYGTEDDLRKLAQVLIFVAIHPVSM